MPQNNFFLCLVALLATSSAHSQSLSGLELGSPLASATSIGLKPTASNEMGPHSLRRWVFPDGNELAVTARRADDRIVYLESNWGGRVPGSPTDFPGVKFGETTLNELRSIMGSNGIAYTSRLMFETGDGLATSNSYEIAGRRGVLLTFVTIVKGGETDLIRSGRRKLGDVAKVDAIILGDADYLDGLWGRDKRSDPNARPVAWPASTDTRVREAGSSGAVAGLLSALECRDGFEPGFVIGGLLRERVIGPRPAQVGDGIPSYVPLTPVLFHGLRAITVEGWSPKGRMFARGPGTAPPTHIGITVEGDETDTKASLQRSGVTIGKHITGKPFLYITGDSYFELALTNKYRGRKLSSIVCSVD